MAQEAHRATARVLDILERLAPAGEGHTLTELSLLVDAPKSSLFPILHTLEKRRYIRQDRQSGRYLLGPGAYVLGAGSAAGQGLESVAQVMRTAVGRCRETCQLGVLDGADVLYLEKAESPQVIRMISRVGSRLPASATAIGKALLSGLTDAAVETLYAGGLPRLTEKTGTDMGRLLAELADIRQNGVALDREECAPQLVCWAVPLRRRGTVFAALSVSVPLFRCTAEQEALVRRSLLEAQAEIEQLAESRDFTLI